MVQTTADWNDIDASVDWAVDEAELAVVDGNSADSPIREFVLRSSQDEPGTLVITRPQGAAAPALDEPPIQMTLSCSIGRLGNPQTEALFLKKLVQRLEGLKGVDFRPL